MTPLAQERPSQATLSRLLTCLRYSDNINYRARRPAATGSLAPNLAEERRVPKQLSLDIDGLPIEVHGHQGGSAYHNLYRVCIYTPLVASLAETSHMVGACYAMAKLARRERRYLYPILGKATQREHLLSRVGCASIPCSPTTTR